MVKRCTRDPYTDSCAACPGNCLDPHPPWVEALIRFAGPCMGLLFWLVLFGTIAAVATLEPVDVCEHCTGRPSIGARK